MSLFKSIADLLTSNWVTIEEVVVFVPIARDTSRTAVEFRNAVVKEHKQTGERVLDLGNRRGDDILPVGVEDGLPNFTEGEGHFGSYVLYNIEYVRDEYDVDEVEQ